MLTKVLEGDEAAISELLEAEKFSDGLPIHCPTRKRVDEFLRFVDRDGDDVVGVVPPMDRIATVGCVAANAIMAGCKPIHFPVVLAAMEAVLEEHFNLRGIATTTNPVGPGFVVNGPIRLEGGYNVAGNALGPGFTANAATGRAIALVVRNIGGAEQQSTDFATLGWPGKYTFCIAENEERSPWEPLHVDRGFDRGTSCVTAVAPIGMVNVLGGDIVPEVLLNSLGSAMRLPASNDHAAGSGSPIFAMCPEHAAVLAKGGYSKMQVRDELLKRSELTLEEMSPHVADIARQQGTRKATGEKALASVENPEDFSVVVTGGPGVHSCFIMSFGESPPLTKEIKWK